MPVEEGSMKRTLFLIRHAKSSWDGVALPDKERPLADRGKRDAPMMGKVVDEIRRPHRDEAQFRAGHRSARPRAQQSAAADRACPRLRRGVRGRPCVRVRARGFLPHGAGAADRGQHRSRAGRLALDLGAQRRAPGECAFPQADRRTSHGERRLGGLDGGPHGGEGGTGDALDRAAQAARLHPGAPASTATRASR